MLPEPYLGHPAAPIVLLSLNPGFSKDDVPFYQDPYAREVWHKNLFHEPLEYPFILLDTGVPQAVGGSAWWRRKLALPLKLVGDAGAARAFFCIEFFPYHSKKYRPLDRVLPSQEYGFHLLREAMTREALVIVMRSQKVWEQAVPQLRRYGRKFVLKNPQNVSVSPGNCPNGWAEIERTLESVKELCGCSAPTTSS